MSKKILTVCLIFVLIFALVCCASCVESASDKLREINLALQHEYSKVALKIITHDDEVDLNADYVMTTSNGITNISYEVERINSFDSNGKIPTEYISTITGTAVYNGNAITSIDGEALSENILVSVAAMSMAFRLSYFSEIKVTDNGINARVSNPKGFLQNEDFDGDKMTVNVKMVQSKLSRIYIRYSTPNDAQVSLDYSFTY